MISIAGHADSSMKGKIARDSVQKLSLDRADSVKTALVKKYQFDPNKFAVEGKAWDEPADPADPLNQTLNRRVEISIYSPESK